MVIKRFGKKLDIKDIIPLSVLNNEGLELLEKTILDKLKLTEINMDFNYISNIRHIQKIEEAKELLLDVINSIEIGLPIDMVEINIKKAWEILGSIIGKYHPEDLIDELFSKFCLGK